MKAIKNLLCLLVALVILPEIQAGAANRPGSDSNAQRHRHSRQAVGQQSPRYHRQDENEGDNHSHNEAGGVAMPLAAAVEVDRLQCPLGCVCQYARYLDLPISRWIDYMKMPPRQPTKSSRRAQKSTSAAGQPQRFDEQQEPQRWRRPEVPIKAVGEQQPKQQDRQGVHSKTIKANTKRQNNNNDSDSGNFNEVTYEEETEAYGRRARRSLPNADDLLVSEEGINGRQDRGGVRDEEDQDELKVDQEVDTDSEHVIAGDNSNDDEEEEEEDEEVEEEEEADLWRRTNPHFKQATCILQEQTDMIQLVQALPHDLQSLILLYTDIGRNKSITISSLKPLNQLTSLEVRGSQDCSMTLIFDASLDFLFHANFEGISLLRADSYQHPPTVKHPSNTFSYKPRSEFTHELTNGVRRLDRDIVKLQRLSGEGGSDDGDGDEVAMSIGQEAAMAHEEEYEILPYEQYAEMVKKSRMPTFYGWERLEVLRIHACAISDVHWEMFDGLQRLRHMSLERNGIATLPPFALYGAMNMRTLSLAHNRIQDLDYRALAGLLKLRWLDLRDNRLANFSELSFPPFNHLERADFRENPLRHIFPASFWVMNGTRELRFGSTEAALELWNDAPFGSLGELRQLEVQNVSIANLEQNVFKGLKSLEVLRLRGSIHSIDFDAFASVPAIRELHLSECGIHRLSMDAFIGCKHLTFLKLSRNNLTSLPPGIFDEQPALSEIYLDGNKLATLPYTFFLQPKLRLARLSDNPWECSCEMSNWRPRITNQERAPAVERCITDFQTGRSLGCHMIEDYQFDRRHAPRCANYNGRSVFYVLRKQLQCGGGRVVHRKGGKLHRQRDLNALSSSPAVETAAQQRERQQLERRDQKQRRTQSQQNSLQFALRQQQRQAGVQQQHVKEDVSNDI